MDKSKVIAAYRQGILSFRECGQILGIGELELRSLMQMEERKACDALRRRRIGS